MDIHQVFNMTSSQKISAYSYNGEPITVIDLGYATVYEFFDIRLIAPAKSNTVTCIDEAGSSVMIGRDSYYYSCAMARLKAANLLFENVLGAI